MTVCLKLFLHFVHLEMFLTYIGKDCTGYTIIQQLTILPYATGIFIYFSCGRGET